MFGALRKDRGLPLPRSRRVSLQARLIASYLVILAIGGLATSLVGSWIVSSTIMREAQRRTERNLATARTIYIDQLESLQRVVELLAGEASESAASLETWAGERAVRLEAVRSSSGFDFMGVTDEAGRVLTRAPLWSKGEDAVTTSPVIRAALRDESAASTEIIGSDRLAAEDPGLVGRARLDIVPTLRSSVSGPPTSTDGLVLEAAAPVHGPGGRISGTIYAGILLNRNLAIVDRMTDVLYRGEAYEGRPVGSVTIFQGAVRVATTVERAEGGRALGTLVSDEVRSAVLEQGRSWNDRAFVVRDWYLSAYEPIRDYDGSIVGILYVGVLERYYSQMRNRVILSFFAIAGFGFLLILGVTYGIMGNILEPIGQMAASARRIAEGDLDQTIRVAGAGEVAVLGESFATMLESIRRMRADLEAWGGTLEQKVEERTQELIEMQSRMARTDRLASVGMLSAGVAHEINNPLGGILTLTALTLEEIPEDDPNRESLEEVVRQAERCKTIVKGLLDFSRQSANSPEPVRLEEAVEEALGLVKSQAAFFNIELTREYEPGLPPVMADRAGMQQVLLNIIMNAVQAMDESGHLTIRTRIVDGLGEVSVTDTGRGIPRDQIDHVFDPFFTTKNEGHGTGLGLSIAYGIVAKHGGSISVESEVGRGTTFTVRLPLTPAFVSVAAEAGRARHATEDEPGRVTRME